MLIVDNISFEVTPNSVHVHMCCRQRKVAGNIREVDCHQVEMFCAEPGDLSHRENAKMCQEIRQHLVQVRNGVIEKQSLYFCLYHPYLFQCISGSSIINGHSVGS